MNLKDLPFIEEDITNIDVINICNSINLITDNIDKLTNDNINKSNNFTESEMKK